MSKREKRKAARIRMHDSDNVTLHLKCDDKEIVGKVWDYSRFGLGVVLDEEECLSGKKKRLNEIVFKAFGQERLLGSGSIMRKTTNNGTAFLGINLDKEFVDMDFLLENRRVLSQEDVRKEIYYYLKNEASIDPEFKAFSSDFTAGLALFKRTMDDLDNKFKSEPPTLKKNLFQSVKQGLGDDLKSFFDRKLNELKRITSSFAAQEHMKHGVYLRRSLWPYISEAEFLRRTNLKPRGYAGDSVMMQMVYRNEYSGKSTFGKILHKHPLEIPSAQAVRNRRALIQDEINTMHESDPRRDLNVFSVACGPAWEMQDYFATSPHRNRINLVLLDQDLEALEEARTGIQSVEGSEKFRVTYLQDSVRTLLRKTDLPLTGNGFDFIYSMGLFDYLSRPVCTALVRKLYTLVAPGGRIMIGNYHVDSPDRAYLDYVMDWPLIYKSEEDMREMAANLPGEADVKVGFEPSGSQMFLSIVKR